MLASNLCLVYEPVYVHAKGMTVSGSTILQAEFPRL